VREEVWEPYISEFLELLPAVVELTAFGLK
jgi:hypothetical protein